MSTKKSPRRRSARVDPAEAAAVPAPASPSSASSSAAPSPSELTLAAVCGYSSHSPPPAVARAAHGWSLEADLARQLRESPGRGLVSGQVLTADFRTKQAKQLAARVAAGSEAPSRPLRLVQWNIERGYRLAELIDVLRAQDADVIALQEVDIGCARSGWLDTGREIASALGMNYAFVCEFEELYSAALRRPDAQGGGVHGNALLTRFDLADCRAIQHAESFAWPERGHEKGEPRLGQRFSLAASVLVGAASPLLVYSAHFEVFTGIYGRLASLRELLVDAAAHAADRPYRAILGDLNTLSHGIARCSPAYCSDWLRVGSLGWTEAEWWVRRVLTDAKQNPLGFYCPFDAFADATLTNYQGWFQGKLDWVLLSNLRHESTWLANNDYHASDHKLLGCTVTFDEPVADGLRFKPKTSSELRALMPLTRARPGIITSCSRRPLVYGAQVAAFWALLAAAAAFVATRFADLRS